MAKPGDIVLLGNDLCLVFDSMLYAMGSKPIEDRPNDLRNLVLYSFGQGNTTGKSLESQSPICSIEDLNLHEVIKAVLKEKGLL